MILSPSLLGADFGTTGLIDIPSARMMDDGEFKFAMSRQTVADIYSLNYQATPWLETTFRYTIFDPDHIAAAYLNDRSYEIKLRLLEERRYLPQLSLGIRDLLGTGAWGSEYLVTSKQFGPLDITLGAGWGRLAERAAFSNPLKSLNDSFAVRNAETGRGGKLNFKDFFSGPDVGIFGGFTYDLGFFNTRLVAEYNSDSYQRERNIGTIPDASPISYGIEWEPVAGITLGINRQQGNQTGFFISASTNTSHILPRRERNLVAVRTTLDQQALEEQRSSWYGLLLIDTEAEGILMRSATISEDGRTASFELSNPQYMLAADAVNDFLTLAEIYLPQQVQTVNVILNEDGIRSNAIRYQRRFGGQETAFLQAEDLIEITPGAPLVNPNFLTGYRIPGVAFTADLSVRTSLFDPDKPLRHQVMLRTGAAADLGRYVNLFATYNWNIENDFDSITRGAGSILPHVRTDIAKYLKQGDTGLENLYLRKQGNLGRDFYYRAYTGYLEEMYAGIGGELLYSPFQSRLAFGANINWVKQRDYDKDFDLLDYSVVTGHVSAYWATPWYHYDLAVHAGRYLAKDYGATFEIRRTFDNGWMVGAWATFTDVSEEDFGEGSFDKGLYISIPFEHILPGNSRSTYTQRIRSIQRDGGQRLEGVASTLWFDLRSTRYDALANNQRRMVPGL